MSDREREKHIEVLENMLEWMKVADKVASKLERIEAVEYAISSLKLHEGKENTEGTTKNNLGVDCVARQDVERYIEGFINEYTPKEELEFINLELDGLKHLPSVTPQEPKTGHWTEEFNDLEGEVRFTCSSCGQYQLFGTDFCYHCGSDNREVVEE